MFICEECAKNRGMSEYFLFAPLSRGPCEDCGKGAVCIDVHHSAVKDFVHADKKATGA